VQVTFTTLSIRLNCRKFRRRWATSWATTGARTGIRISATRVYVAVSNYSISWDASLWRKGQANVTTRLPSSSLSYESSRLKRYINYRILYPVLGSCRRQQVNPHYFAMLAEKLMSRDDIWNAYVYVWCFVVVFIIFAEGLLYLHIFILYLYLYLSNYVYYIILLNYVYYVYHIVFSH